MQKSSGDGTVEAFKDVLRIIILSEEGYKTELPVILEKQEKLFFLRYKKKCVNVEW